MVGELTKGKRSEEQGNILGRSELLAEHFAGTISPMQVDLVSGLEVSNSQD